MKREIYEVYAKVTDANGAYNTLSGYPKVYDSHQNNDDCEKARQKAYGEYHSVLGAMYTRTDRQCQVAMIIRASDGLQIEKTCIGKIADIPDPTYTATITNGSGSGEYTQGSRVTIVANTAPEGKIFSEWSGAVGLAFESGDATSENAVFIMPAENVSLTATYIDEPVPNEE